MPGFPVQVDERRAKWAAIPRRARAAIRRLHHMLGHKPREVMIQIMKGSHAPQEYIDAIKYFRRDACVLTDRAPKTHPVAAPSHYAFNHELHVDVLTLHDMEGMRRLFLSVVDCGTTFHMVAFVRHG